MDRNHPPIGPTNVQLPPKENPMFASLVRFIQEWKRYSRSVSELSRLDDRELADIGLNRSEIERAAWSAAQQH